MTLATNCEHFRFLDVSPPYGRYWESLPQPYHDPSFAVESPKTCLHMGHGDVELCRGQSPGQGAVRIPIDHDEIRLFFQQYFFNAL